MLLKVFLLFAGFFVSVDLQQQRTESRFLQLQRNFLLKYRDSSIRPTLLPTTNLPRTTRYQMLFGKNFAKNFIRKSPVILRKSFVETHQESKILKQPEIEETKAEPIESEEVPKPNRRFRIRYPVQKSFNLNMDKNNNHTVMRSLFGGIDRSSIAINLIRSISSQIPLTDPRMSPRILSPSILDFDTNSIPHTTAANNSKVDWFQWLEDPTIFALNNKPNSLVRLNEHLNTTSIKLVKYFFDAVYKNAQQQEVVQKDYLPLKPRNIRSDDIELLETFHEKWVSSPKLRAFWRVWYRKNRGLSFAQINQLMTFNGSKPFEDILTDNSIVMEPRVLNRTATNKLYAERGIKPSYKIGVSTHDIESFHKIMRDCDAGSANCPVFQNPLILDPKRASSPDIINPLIMSPYILSPYVFGPFIISPLILTPQILSPSVLSPTVLAPLVLAPVIVSPQLLNPTILSPLVLSPYIVSPGLLSPTVLSPSVLSPCIVSPTGLSPVILSPSALSPGGAANKCPTILPSDTEDQSGYLSPGV